MTSKYLGTSDKMQGMVAGNRSRENQEKDETINDITDRENDIAEPDSKQ